MARRLASLSPAVAAALALPLFAVLAAAARASSLAAPLSEDTGVYLYFGDVILDGGAPYADAADNKGPLTYLLFAGIRLVSGISTTGVRLTLVAFAALTALAVAAYVSRFAGRGAALVAGAACALLGSTPKLEGPDPNTEQYGVAPLAAAWWLSARGTVGSAAGAGALSAAGMLMNPGFAPVVLVVAIGLWFQGGSEQRLRRFLAAAGGGVAAAVPFALWLLAVGALDDFWVQVIGKAGDVVSQDGSGGFATRPLFDFTGRGLYALGAAGALLGLSRRELRQPSAAALLWVVLMWLRVKSSSYEFAHHYYLGVPGIAAGIGLGGAAAAHWVRGRRPWAEPVAWALVAVGLAATTYVYVGRDERAAFQRPADERTQFPRYAEAYPVADFIRGRTRPGALIFVAGNNAVVYWRADRRAPTRFFADYPLTEPGYRAQRLRSLARRPPDAVAVLPGGSFFLDDTRRLLRRHPYRLAYSSGGSRVWLLDRRPRS